MNNHSNNPAGRLLKIIKSLKSLANSEKNLTTDAGWAKVLNIEISDTGLLLDRIGHVYQLVNKIAELLKPLSVKPELYLRDINTIGNAFREMNLRSSLAETVKRFSDTCITGLEYCDDFLSREAPEKQLDRTDLKKIYDDILALCDEVIKSDIDAYLKQYLLDKLDMLRQAIEMYDISGSKPIETAVNDILGSALLNNKLREPTGKPIPKKFIFIVVGLLQLIGGFNDIVQLPESVDKALPGSKQVASEIVQSHKATSQDIQEDTTGKVPSGKDKD